MSDPAPWLSDPNGSAYRKEERRIGPPLDYVGEKQRSALEELHRSLVALDRTRSPPSSAFADAERAVLHAFHYQITAFLALYDLLGVHSGHDYVERLRRMGGDEFDRWLSFIEREGSIAGEGTGPVN